MTALTIRFTDTESAAARRAADAAGVPVDASCPGRSTGTVVSPALR